MTIPSFNSWIPIEINSDQSHLIQRAFSAHCQYDSNTLLILGGENKNGKSKEIIVWKFDDKFSFGFQRTQLFLPIEQLFDSRQGEVIFSNLEILTLTA